MDGYCHGRDYGVTRDEFPDGSICLNYPAGCSWDPGRVDWKKLEFGNMQTYIEERDGGYYIAGTRIALSSIVHAFQIGESPDEILRSFPLAGPLVKIHGAITFYLENKEKVEAYLKEQDRRWEALRQEYPKPDDPLAKKLHEAKEHAAQTRS